MSPTDSLKPVIVNHAITSPRLKTGLFVIEGMNALSTVYFFYYIYFLMKERFGFGALENLILAAVLGLIYGTMAIFSGRFAQKKGYLVVLRFGTALMLAAFFMETVATSLPAVLGLMMMGSVGMCASWPALEALISDGEPPARLQGLLGTYNVIWAVASAFAYFTGGVIIQHGGWNCLFLISAGLQCLEFLVASWIQKNAPHQPVRSISVDSITPITHESLRSPIPPQTFLKMGWLANPFAYLAIATVVSVIPTLAAKFQLNTAQSGFVCSIWLFVRAGAFALLWLWPKWHYRFRYLAGCFVALTVSFVVMLLTPSLWLLIVAEVFFGIALGLIYYSSLFYSMDVGQTKGEHGGIHESVIGFGCFAGPAVAACGLKFFPGSPSSGAWAVTILLFGGLSGLYWLRYRK